MTTFGKSINLFLMDGIPNGRVKCTLANWTGVAYRIPRTSLEQCRDREHLKQSGIYFLFGVSDQTDEQVVYIGQASVRKNEEGIFCRLNEHKLNSDKDYWNEAVVFTTSNNSFGPTEISYLENRFYTLALKANRYIVKNNNEPSQGNVTEEKQSELEEFIDYAKIIMGVLGYNVFEPLLPQNVANPPVQTENPILQTLYINRIGANATCCVTSENFIVMSGSKIRKVLTSSCPNGTKNARKKYALDIDKDDILLKDIPFKSPSAASSFVLGASTNGNTEWKTAEGKLFKDIEL